jgi:hypothetical protein
MQCKLRVAAPCALHPALKRFADADDQSRLTKKLPVCRRCIARLTGIRTNHRHSACQDTEIFGDADFPIRIAAGTVIFHLLTPRMDVQRQPSGDVDVGTQIKIATVFTVSNTE